jgi:glycosyltransferase involved in cell wall biosynthesis
VVFQSYASSIEALKAAPRRRSTFNVLISGRLVPLKGFNAAVAAFAALVRETGRVGVSMTIVGSGELRESLARQVQAESVQDLVRVVPWVAQHELRDFYASASVFLYPSFEAQGLVVAEAMGAGVPVVCLEGTGPAFLAEGSGQIVPRESYSRTVQSLKERLRVLYDAHLADSMTGAYLLQAESARREYDERLDWSVVVDNICRIYERV